jgi:hypothetical protein
MFFFFPRILKATKGLVKTKVWFARNSKLYNKNNKTNKNNKIKLKKNIKKAELTKNFYMNSK